MEDNYATWPSRAKAVFLDAIFLFILQISFGLILAFLFGSADFQTGFKLDYSKDPQFFIDFSSVASVLGFVLGVIYAPFFMRRHYKNGESPGKEITKIKVINYDHRPISFFKALQRESLVKGVLITFLPFFLFYLIYPPLVILSLLVILGNYLNPLRDTKNRAWHDLICKTLVVEVKK